MHFSGERTTAVYLKRLRVTEVMISKASMAFPPWFSGAQAIWQTAHFILGGSRFKSLELKQLVADREWVGRGPWKES